MNPCQGCHQILDPGRGKMTNPQDVNSGTSLTWNFHFCMNDLLTKYDYPNGPNFSRRCCRFHLLITISVEILHIRVACLSANINRNGSTNKHGRFEYKLLYCMNIMFWFYFIGYHLYYHIMIVMASKLNIRTNGTCVFDVCLNSISFTQILSSYVLKIFNEISW